jgi:hypothetical protein
MADQKSSTQWILDYEEHLIEKGWKRSGTDSRNLPMFSDPNGRTDNGVKKVTKKDPKTGNMIEVYEPVETRTIEIINREGKKESWKQIVGPPIQWDYSIEEAYQIQATRDKEAVAKEEAAKTAPVEAPRSPINPNVTRPNSGNAKKVG